MPALQAWASMAAVLHSQTLRKVPYKSVLASIGMKKLTADNDGIFKVVSGIALIVAEGITPQKRA